MKEDVLTKKKKKNACKSIHSIYKKINRFGKRTLFMFIQGFSFLACCFQANIK
jgi:hypothetical protein